MMRSFIQRVPSGSRPDVGSSRMTSSGSLMSACARPMRCACPGILLQGAFVAFEADHLDEFLRPAVAQGGREVEQPAVEVERLLGGQVPVQVRLLGQVANALVLLHLGRRLAEDVGLAIGREEQAEEEFDGGGLAGAVGAEEAEDLAAVDFEVESAGAVFF
jgi:hypothetical protein